MTTSDTRSVRRAGIVGTAGGVLTALSGAAVATYVVPVTDVPDTMWSYPWSSGALVPVSVAYAVLHGLVLVGLLGFGRSGVAGDGRAARLGVMAAVVGTAVLFVAELLSIPVASQRVDDTGAGLVAACFGVGTIVSAVGFVVAGVATLRARRWDGWRRFTPLATGIWLAAMMALVMTPALAVAVMLYGLLLTALGVALVTRPAPRVAQPERV
jgi:hypothetical protein